MGKYFTIKDGKVLDWKFKKQMDFIYTFYIGDTFIGQIFKMGKQNWSAVEKGTDKHVAGFRSRHCAAEFLLKNN